MADDTSVEQGQARLPGLAEAETLTASGLPTVLVLTSDLVVKYNDLAKKYNELISALRMAKLGI